MHNLSTYALVMLFAGTYFFRMMGGWRDFVSAGEGWRSTARCFVLFSVAIASGSCFAMASRTIVDGIGVGPLSTDAAAILVTGILCSFWLAKAVERVCGR